MYSYISTSRRVQLFANSTIFHSYMMATNNGTLEVQNDAYTHSSNDSEAGALSATNKGIVVVKNEVISI